MTRAAASTGEESLSLALYDIAQLLVCREGDTPPAAALTAYAGEDRGEALASGFRMLLDKAIDPRALIAAVATLAQSESGAAAQLPLEGGRVA